MLLTDSHRNHAIDLLRFVAASWVALFHFNSNIPYSITDNYYRVFCSYGYLGVPIFFALSGYCMGLAESHVKSPQVFLIKRLFRIFPPYWFSLFVFVLCVLIVKMVTGTNSVNSLPKNIENIVAIIFLYIKPLSKFEALNSVHWTLVYELTFYLVLFSKLFLPTKIRPILILSLSVLGIIIPNSFFTPLFVFNEVSTFLIGYSFYYILNNKSILWLQLTIFISSFIGLSKKHSSEYIAIVILVCSLLFIDKLRPLKDNYLSKLGDYSYSIYLVHIPIGIFLTVYLRRNYDFANHLINNMIFDLIMLSFVILVSRLIFYNIELPSIDLGRKLSKAVEKRK